MSSEKTLLELARKYDEQALAEVYDTYSPGIYRYATRLLGDQDLAEECVAETFSRFLIAVKRGKGPRNYLQAYLYRVAHNWITDQYRRGPAPTVELEPELHTNPGLEPEQAFKVNAEQEEIRAALQKLTPDQRQVIVLKYMQGWRNREIAKSMQKPVGAIKALQHRAIVALRRHLMTSEEV